MTTKEKVLHVLEQKRDVPTSGQKIADSLSLSRTAVWKAIKQLRQEGHKISGETKNGYILEHYCKLSENGIRQALPLKYRELGITIFDITDSTNTQAKILSDNGAKHGSVVLSEEQTAGRGRSGRSFFSPKGTGLYMSMVLRPNNVPVIDAQMITVAAAVQVAKAIEDLCDVSPKIKWVNDLYLNSRKISGILTEGAVTSDGKSDFAILGIGVNIRSVKRYFSDDLLEIASSLEDETGKTFSVSEIAAEIINELDNLLQNFEKAEFIKEYRERSCIIGADVLVSKQGRETVAKAVGISDRAGLIVRYSDGTEEILTSGEARIKKS